MSRLDDKLAALATMSPAQLRGEWLQLFGSAAPHAGHKLLGLAIAHRLQEKGKGGLPAKITREIDTMIKHIEKGEEIKASASATLRPGTQLVREWRGSTHRVMILDDSYLYRDQRYGSLSEIARKITGAHWSGPRFFGLKKTGAGAAS
ncbi:hypothetical protein ASE00_09460 [Sphingomonas sp. Root710]|uniref:DUF2924 domain-containing protein n=1 Tax=Sphingomonas sp. Root710 TaxID=1736594 RepID=UPI0006F59657|nr:DUF2924 domain-containing protein [Sphingomonas sp. Root710]KRB82301.1 hypothetical protein ASE00_09460 [Sphingomonas sp. Root710]